MFTSTPQDGSCVVCGLTAQDVAERSQSGHDDVQRLLLVHPSGSWAHFVHLCWCGDVAAYRQPVDPMVTAPSARMTDGEPGQLVCMAHVDRDGMEMLPLLELPDGRSS